MSLTAKIELPTSHAAFDSGLLLEILAGLASTPPGELLALTTTHSSVAEDLERWSRLTGNTILERTAANAGTRWVLRKGRASSTPETERPLGTRLWLYTNFDCNLACTYCCVRSSPKAARRELGLETVRRIASEARELGVHEVFVTGGEPLLLPDIVPQVSACAELAHTTVLTNGALLHGRRLDEITSLPTDRVAFQISVDSPTAELHDRQRGPGSWLRALRGIAAARERGFRVRLAATIADDADERTLAALAATYGISRNDTIVRRVARRGFAETGVALARSDLLPEVTITSAGVYWHPVGADDTDLLVTTAIFPLERAFAEVRAAYDRERSFHRSLMQVFRCA